MVIVARLLALLAAVYSYCCVEVAFGTVDDDQLILLPTTAFTLSWIALTERRRATMFLIIVFLALNLYAIDLHTAWPTTRQHVARIFSLRLLIFALAALCAVVPGGGRDDDAKVQFAPHEQRIRQLVRRHEPSQLHRVDDWLSDYCGRENELFRILEEEYARHSQEGSSKRSSTTVVVGMQQVAENISSLHLDDNFM